MADVREIVRQLAALAEELGRELDAALASSGAEARARQEELAAELEQLRAEKDDALSARQEAERELDLSEKRIESLVLKLKDARQAAIEAGEEAQRTMRRQLEALQSECDEARSELEGERSIRKRLEKGAAADEKRLSDLEKALASGEGAAGKGGDSAELRKLQAELSAASETIDKERRTRKELEGDVAAASKRVAALELTLKKAESAVEAGAGGDSAAQEQLEELTERLKSLEAELSAEQQLCRRYAKDCAEAQRRVAEMESSGGGGGSAPLAAESPLPAAKPAGDKPLPHELRPAPKPGALFRPEWDLQALPCDSAEQILQAWASVSNVQLSLEGYPSQYCSAYLTVIKQGRQKQLYLLFNLKGIKHILVCVPTTAPKDEASLGKLVAEGQKYLLMSGFDLEKLPVADIPKRLGYYLQS